MNRNHIITILAILDNAIDHLWDGEGNVWTLPGSYRDNPEYMCHAVEFAIAEVVKGERSAAVFISYDKEYGGELKDKIMATIPGAETADGYCAKNGISGVVEVQAFRKQALQSIRAEYAEKLAKIVKASELVSYAAANNFREKDGQYDSYGHLRSMFTCVAVGYAAEEFERVGRDATEALEMVKTKIAECLGVAHKELSNVTFEGVLNRLFGELFVKTQGFEWRQARRMEMMQRIAQQLRNEEN